MSVYDLRAEGAGGLRGAMSIAHEPCPSSTPHTSFSKQTLVLGDQSGSIGKKTRFCKRYGILSPSFSTKLDLNSKEPQEMDCHCQCVLGCHSYARNAKG